MPTAILVDGDFFIRRYRYLRGNQLPEKAARDLHWMCCQHLKDGGKKRCCKLYRIFFYDCPPLTKSVQNPVTKKGFRLADTATAKWRIAFHEELKKRRKVALRLGYLNERMGQWVIKPPVLKLLLQGSKTLEELAEHDVRYEVKQMGVDMRIGLDIASMAYKKQVDQIVLVAGDSDFVPAAKLARREGVDFILDPMWATIRADLHEHIDGLRSVFTKGKAKPTDSIVSIVDPSTDGSPVTAGPETDDSA
jgi:uncharacterized LabA/DUF88 family protein